MVKWLKKHLSSIILLTFMLVGICLVLYPTVSDSWNNYHQSRAIASYVSELENLQEEDRKVLLEAAKSYNQRLSKTGIMLEMTQEEQEEYRTLLDITGTGIMGYVQVNCIGVNLPIYHGTDEAVLQIAIGHIAGTSLPVEEESLHIVLSGHRGLPSAKLFSDLDKVVEGDTFTVSVLGNTMTFQVDQIRIVEPSDTSNLQIVSGEKYCTLVTCTPYGVNSHRLLVRGHRIENLAGEVTITADAVRIPPYLVIPAVLIPLLFVSLLCMLLIQRSRAPRITREELRQYFREKNDCEKEE